MFLNILCTGETHFLKCLQCSCWGSCQFDWYEIVTQVQYTVVDFSDRLRTSKNFPDLEILRDREPQSYDLGIPECSDNEVKTGIEWTSG